MKRKLSNQRALRITTAARREFARWGFEGARMDRIARTAGVNKQLLYYYYRSKQGLFHVVLHQAASELAGGMDGVPRPDGPPLERLGAAVVAQFDHLARQPDLVNLLTHGARGEAAVFAPAIRRLVVLLAEGQGLGRVRGDVDPHVAAMQALVLMLGYLRFEPLLTASAPALGGDALALRARWRGAAADLFVEGVRAGG